MVTSLGEGGGQDNFLSIYGIVWMCVPNGPHFQRFQVYDWSRGARGGGGGGVTSYIWHSTDVRAE